MKTTSYLVAVGEPQHKGGKVGSVWGALSVVNSGVGYCSLRVSVHLVRLICSNGMKAPIPHSDLLRRRHVGLHLETVADQILAGMARLPDGLNRSMQVLDMSTQVLVDDVAAEVRRVLQGARLPVRFVDGIVHSHEQEPMHTAFGVSQAVTAFARDREPEERAELEGAAGTYLLAATAGLS